MTQAISITVTGRDGKARTYNFDDLQTKSGKASIVLLPGDQVKVAGGALANAVLSQDCSSLVISLPSSSAGNAANNQGAGDAASGDGEGGGKVPQLGSHENSIELGNFFYNAPEYYMDAPILLIESSNKLINVGGNILIDPQAAKKDDESGGGGGDGDSEGSGGSGSNIAFSQASMGTGGMSEGVCNVSVEHSTSINPLALDDFLRGFDFSYLNIIEFNQPLIITVDPLDAFSNSSVRRDFGGGSSNTPPIALNDNYTFLPFDSPQSGSSPFTFSSKSGPVILPIINNDSDPDGDSLSITAIVPLNVKTGSLTLSQGQIVFTPDTDAVDQLGEGEQQLDTFQYTISDGRGGFATAIGTIVTEGENDPPTAVDNDYTMFESSLLSADMIQDNTGKGRDSDPDLNDTLRIIGINGQLVTPSQTIILASGASLTPNSNGTFTYNPNSNNLAVGQSTTDSFTYTIADTSNASSSANVSITIQGVDDPPTARNNDYTTDETTALAVNIITDDTGSGVDSDPDIGDQLSIVAVGGIASNVGVPLTLISGATVTINSNGTLAYDPSTSSTFNQLKLGETANDTLTYTISDQGGHRSTATVNITITGLNSPPDAVNDTGNAVEDGPTINIALLPNDSDPEGDLISVDSIDTTGTVGDVTLNPNGTVDYDVGNNFQNLGVGQTTTDTFQYTITDTNGGTDTATVIVTITGTNDGPTAVNNTYTTDDNTAAIGNVITDNTGIGVDSDPDDNDTLTAIELNGSAATIGTPTVLASGATVTLNANGTFNYDPNTATAFNILTSGQSANDSFTYTIEDGSGLTDTATVNIVVQGINDDPNALDNDYTTDEDTATTGNLITDDTGDGVDNDLDSPGPFTVIAVNGVGAAIGVATVLPSGATVTQNADGSFNYDPSTSATFNALAIGDSAADSYTYTISDGNGGSGTAIANFTIEGVNDAPSISTITNTTTFQEDIALAAIPTISVASLTDTEQTDPDAGAIKGIAIFLAETQINTVLNGLITAGTWQFSTDGGANFTDVPAVSNTNALVLAPSALLRFVPVTDFSGTVLLNYRAWDQTDNLASGTTGVNISTNGGTTPYSTQVGVAQVSVTNINDAPLNDNNLTPAVTAITEDISDASNTGMTVGNLLAAVFSDTDDTFIKNANNLTPIGGAFTSSQDINGVWQYSINGGTTWIDFGLITQTNAVLLSADARIRFVPNADFSGNAEITFRTWDSSGGLPSGTTGVNASVGGGTSKFSALLETAVITVNPVNDAPVLDTNNMLSVTDGGTKTITNSTLKITDIDNSNDELVLTVLTLPANGTLKRNGIALNVNDTFTQEDIDNNLLTYEHVTSSGDQSFTFSVTDDQGGNIGTTTFNIAVNAAPTATDDVFTVGKGSAVNLFVLGNDTDPENDTLTVTSITSAPNQGGSATINPNGSIAYQSLPFFTGTESFSYEISDGKGNTDTATVTLTVREGDVESSTLSTDGFTIEGASANSNAGAAVAFAYDVNGDGFDEVIVGQPNSGTGGVVNMVFGKTSTTTVDTSSLGALGKTFTGTTVNARAGFSLDSLGDMNNDGLGDFVVGAPGVTSNTVGNVFNIHGDSPAAVLFAGLNPLEALTAKTGNNSGAGRAVGGGGDVNGDGLKDVVFSTPASDKTTVLFGQTTTGSVSTTGSFSGFNITGAPDVTANATVDILGDVTNNDGLAEIIIGDPTTQTVFVIHGKTSTTAVNLASLGSNGITVTGASFGDNFGFSVSDAGDVNGDSIRDFIIGAPGTTVNSVASAGVAYVIFGSNSLTNVDIANLGSGGFKIQARTSDDLSGGDQLGHSVNAAGDVNGDGFDDVIVGAKFDDPNGDSGAGAAYVIYGKSTTSTVNIADIQTGTGGFAINGDGASDQLGVDVSSAGDVNGDGFGDLIVGAHQGDINGANAGQAYVIFGGIFNDQVSHLGTTGDDTLTGNASKNVMVAGTGNDTLIGNGGADVLLGGAGNDRFEITDLNFQRIDGGNGTDTFAFTGTNGVTIDFSAIPAEKIRGIEIIDIGNGAADTINITFLDILNLSPTSNTILIEGDSTDSGTINLIGGGFGAGVVGVSTTVFTGTNSVVEVDNDLTLVNVII